MRVSASRSSAPRLADASTSFSAFITSRVAIPAAIARSFFAKVEPCTTARSIWFKIFNQMDRAVVHGSTFAKNDLAMAAGIATLEVMKAEKLVEASAKRGAELRLALTRMVPGYELMKEVRGKGLMIGVEFGPPKSLRLKASWNLLETANKGLFCQLITVPLFKDHKILTQVSGHGSHTIKLLPPLVITEEDCSWIEKSFDDVIAASHKVPGAIWSLGKTLVDNAVRKSA